MPPRKKKETVNVKEEVVPEVMTAEQKADEELLEECIQHQTASARWIETAASSWDEKESMLLGMLEDTLSKKQKSKVFDHRLSTIIFERAARVMAQNPKGRAFAVSKNDIGKNALMNMLMKFGVKMDTMQFSHLLKNRLMDLYSMVYGSMFSLEFWLVDAKRAYIGPQSYIIAIRDAFPQPGIKNVNDMQWFIVRTMMALESLKAIAKLKGAGDRGWRIDNINRLLKSLKEAKFEGDKTQSTYNTRSYVERNMFPNEQGDKTFPNLEIFTEYRLGLWITWASQQVDSKTSKNFLLRVSKKEKVFDKMLPVCVKHCFPLIDSPIGLGEFERGKTLQYALNSLINLYLDGVKYSIFPPLAINPDNVTPSSIKWGSGEMWFMNAPGQDVKPVDLSPRGIETFNQTYSFMLSALYNQAGTSEVNQSTKTDTGLGKTPQAIRLQAVKESARDEWDRFMMEDYLMEKYRRWVAMYASFQETDVTMRLFKDEIEELEKTAPDVKDLLTRYESGRGELKVNRTALADEKGNEVEWDYEIEAGSTTKPSIESDQENLTSILKAVIENQQIQEALAAQGKQVDIGELFRMWVKSANNPNVDVDRIIVPLEVKDAGQKPGAPLDQTTPPDGQVPPEVAAAVAAAAGQGGPAVPPEAAGAPVPPEAAPQAPPTPSVPEQDQGGTAAVFRDPDIQALMRAVTGGTPGIPSRA